MINADFEFGTNLQYINRDLKHRLKKFETGEKYLLMKAEREKRLAEKDVQIKKLKLEIGTANSTIITNRKKWEQVFDDMEKAHAKELCAKDRRIKKWKKRTFEAEHRVDELEDIRKEQLNELYAIKCELEEMQEKNHKLLSQLNKDHENSSLPSSMKIGRKKIANSREKTGKKQGAQPGHKGHCRKWHEPTNIIDIPPPDEYVNGSKFRETGKTVAKQVVNLAISVIVDEYRTPEFLHKPTGKRVHANFPDGVVNDVNYGGSVKATSFLLNNYCFVSIDKTREFLSALTNGQLEISRGMINALSKEFAKKTQKEQAQSVSKLISAPVMHVDFTGVRVNGKTAQVLVCANNETALYRARKHKGHEGVKDTPAEDYQGILVHDHDRTFYSYGGLHQECLAHILRYLKGSIENEPSLTWNKQMQELLREMIHYRNTLDPDADAKGDVVEKFERRYLEILETAKNEYEYEPPSRYYKDGFNLHKRLLEFKESHLLFLHDKRVPADNNVAERLLRVLKRKQKQVMTFRSFDSMDSLCTSLGIVALLRTGGENLYTKVASMFA